MSRHGILQRIHRWLRFANDVLLIPMFTIIVLEFATGSTEAFGLGFDATHIAFCALFLLEWVLGLIIAKHRVAYLSSPARIADLLSAVPLASAFQGIRAVRVIRAIRLLRVAWRARRYRGKAKDLVRLTAITMATVFAGAAALRILEPMSVPRMEDALWWSLITVSTVGYGDITPESTSGRFVAAGLVTFGVAVFGYAAGFMATLIQDPEEELMLEQARRIEAKLDILIAHLDLPMPEAKTKEEAES